MKGSEGGSSDIAKRVGAAIARNRKAAGFTQIRVADALGLEKESVSRIETGATAPTIFRIEQFAELFGCPLSALFGEYRGKSLEDSAELAELMADLPADAQRAAMRMISEFAGVVREREELRRQVDFLRVRIAKMERDILNDMLDRETKPSRRKKI